MTKSLLTTRAARALLSCGLGAAMLWGCATPAPTGPAAQTLAASSANPARPPPPRRVRRPDERSGEYLRSWGMRAVNAQDAYRAGATGRGVTVALIDSGLSGAQPEISRRASADSIDLIDDRQAAQEPGRRHGAQVAGPLAASLNGRGTVGIAYEATLLSIRADMDNACVPRCAFHVREVARGIDYALQKGARIIVLAVEGRGELTPTFTDALARAAAAGAVVVISAGNGGRDEASWPARYAADPRYRGSVIAVGATNTDGLLTRWSNRAGVAREVFLAAPGQNVITGCDLRFCYLTSGTSFSTSYVAGALALLMDKYPQLSGREAAALLLENARDLGEAGADAVNGRGLLDVAAAFRAAEAAQGSRS